MPVNWLIAEDEADIRNLVGIMCQVWGHIPLTFETGQKVWDWLDEVEAGKVTTNLPEFALMDIRMPGRRGNEIAARIRDVEKIKHIPIVLMTAFVLSEDEIDRLRQDYGVDHVINKPLPDFDRLGIILHDIIKKKQSAPKPEPVKVEAIKSEPTRPIAIIPQAPTPEPIKPIVTPPESTKPVVTSPEITKPIAIVPDSAVKPEPTKPEAAKPETPKQEPPKQVPPKP